MFVLILVNSWSISIGFKFWMIEAALARIGRAEICSFIVLSFFLKPLRAVDVVAADRLVTPITRIPIRLARDNEVSILHHFAGLFGLAAERNGAVRGADS